MDFRSFLRTPLSTLRRWGAGHERLLPVHLSWALAALLAVYSIVKLIRSLSLL